MPTQGYTGTPGANSWGEGWNVGNQVAQQISYPSSAGGISAIHCYAATFAGTATMILVVWDGNGNVLAHCNASSSSNTSPAYVSGSLATPLTFAGGGYAFVGWANPNNTSSNSGFTAHYNSVSNNTAKWDLQTSPPGNILTGGNATQYTSRQLGIYYDYTLAPAITSFTPTAGGITTSVVITGTDFTGATAVTFNGTSASYTVNSGTQITATVPTGATTGPITVITPYGSTTSSATFTVSSIWVNTGTSVSPVWTAAAGVVVNTGTSGAPVWTDVTGVAVNTGTSGSPIWTPGG